MDEYIPLKSGLRFHFEGDGSWSAASRLTDDGAAFSWRITVLCDGSFDVSRSDRELTDPVPSFASLDAAIGYCDDKEDALMVGVALKAK